MERDDPLLPFAFKSSSKDEKIVLNTDPKDRYARDQDASSMFQTRRTQRDQVNDNLRNNLRGPILLNVPSIKRKMGESFTEKDDIKRRDYDDFFLKSDDLKKDLLQSTADIPATQSIVITHFDEQELHSAKDLLNSFPSSPPVIDPVSEYDLINHDITIPDSPAESALQTSPIKPQMVTQSSEADFGIDSFNRFKFSSLNHPSTDNIEMGVFNDRSKHSKARQIILQSFEDMCPSVSLAHMDLDDIPDEIRDLNNLVIFDQSIQATRQVYLNNNNLRILNPHLFEFTKLNVLSLRHNKLVFLPNLIEKFTELRDLNVSINKLRHLPPLILNFSHLHTFRAGPNPFIEIDEYAVKVLEDDPRFAKGLRWVSPMTLNCEDRNVCSLKSLCLDAIANYDVTYRETKSWKRAVPKMYHSLIALAISKGQFQEKCNECNLIVVESYAKIYEWWDILQNKDIPIKRRFCSGKCVRKYLKRHQLS